MSAESSQKLVNPISIRISEPHLSGLHRQARWERRSIANIIRISIEEYLEKYGPAATG